MKILFLEAALNKAGIDRIHRENQNIYDTALTAMTERYRYGDYYFHHPPPPIYPPYLEPPIVKEDIIVKPRSRMHWWSPCHRYEEVPVYFSPTRLPKRLSLNRASDFGTISRLRAMDKPLKYGRNIYVHHPKKDVRDYYDV